MFYAVLLTVHLFGEKLTSMTDEKKKETSMSPEKGSETNTRPLKSRSISRRGFIKVAAFASVAAGTTAIGAKAVSTFMPEPDFSAQYERDRRAGDRIIARTRLVEMTGADKKGLVRDLKKSYKYSKKV
jgi:hypothetical protein